VIRRDFSSSAITKPDITGKKEFPGKPETPFVFLNMPQRILPLFSGASLGDVSVDSGYNSVDKTPV